MTDGGKKEMPDLSLAMEAFTDFFDFKHDYPKDNFGAQMVRFLKLKQNLFGFVSSPDKKRRSFWDYVGSDGMVRPYMNIYGAQTSRTQPASTGFMFLKPAWMRALVVPPKGKAMAGIDFGSQEFLLSALLSNDLEMIEAYMSGDPYLAFGKLRNVIPKDGTKATHKIEREMCKSSVLGISYAMTKYGLAIKMTADTGKICSEDEAQEWINEFYNAFPDLAEYKKDIEDSYEDDRFLKLSCGWYLFGDNENPRSVGNFLVQGLGSTIMRKAVDIAVEKGVQVVKTLHDAIYIIYDIGDEKQILKLRDAMIEAMGFYFTGRLKEMAMKIKLDPFAWSPDYSEGEMDVEGWKVPTSPLYIDERAIGEYKQFSKYFEDSDADLL
jgi:hypothetical protein